MNLSSRSAVELLSLLSRLEVSSVEVVQSHLDAIAERDGRLNAIAVGRFDEALAEASATDRRRAGGRACGPLGGLPVTVKECFDLVGMPTTAGAEHLRRRPSGRDAAVVAALRTAGAIVLGKTNLAQLCWGLETSNPVYGRTDNPWDQERTPGGSSGGEGAAVSAGLSSVGIGTDSGGSVRIPAHYCGIHALKPTSGRLSSSGTVDELLLSYQPVVTNQPGVLAREVKDLSLVYEVLASSPKAALVPQSPARRAPRGAAHRDPRGEAPPGERPPVSRPTVGFFAGGIRPPAAAVERLLAEAVEALEAAGVEVRSFEPPSLERAKELFDAAFALDRGASLRSLANGSTLDHSVEEVLDNLSRSAVPEPLGTAGPLLDACEKYRSDFSQALDASGADLLLCPPTGVVAHPHGMSQDLDGMPVNTQLFNLLGLPAGIVSLSVVRLEEEGLLAPRGCSDEVALAAGRGTCGLPVAVQVAGRHWQERAVLDMMGLLEEAFRGAAHYPVHSVTAKALPIQGRSGPPR